MDVLYAPAVAASAWAVHVALAVQGYGSGIEHAGYPSGVEGVDGWAACAVAGGAEHTARAAGQAHGGAPYLPCALAGGAGPEPTQGEAQGCDGREEAEAGEEGCCCYEHATTTAQATSMRITIAHSASSQQNDTPLSLSCIGLLGVGSGVEGGGESTAGHGTVVG